MPGAALEEPRSEPGDSGRSLALVVSGGASAVLGSLVLVGWYVHAPALIQVVPGFVPMQYNTALGFLLSGAGLLAAAYRSPRLAHGLGAVVGFLGLATLAQYILGVDLGLD